MAVLVAGGWMESLDGRVAELEQRIAQLEARVGAGGRAGNERVEASLDVLDHLRQRSGPRYERGGDSGAITYAGAVHLDDRPHLWAREHSVPDLLEADWGRAARLLERLASPARLALLAALLHAPRSRKELQEALGETSSGHLYHHLRDLQGAGLLVQQRRGEHQLVAHAVVPLLTIIAAALDLEAGGDLPEPEPVGRVE